MICKCCVQQLNAAYQFRVQVINSDYKLHNAIKDLENLNDSGGHFLLNSVNRMVGFATKFSRFVFRNVFQ